MVTVRGMRACAETLGPLGLLRTGLAVLSGTQRLVEVHRVDLAHPLWLRVPSTDIDVYRQVFFAEEYLLSLPQQPEVIIDAGANIGLTSVYFASRYPDARIIAIEPEPGNFDLLKRNVSPYPNVTAVQAALWSRNEVVSLVDPGLGEWGFSVRDRQTANSAPDGAATVSGAGRPRTAGLRVPGLTVADVMRDADIEQVDLLKLDIEGAEVEVFDTACEWIEAVDSIIIELHDRLRPGCTDALRKSAAGLPHESARGECICLSRDAAVRF